MRLGVYMMIPSVEYSGCLGRPHRLPYPYPYPYSYPSSPSPSPSPSPNPNPNPNPTYMIPCVEYSGKTMRSMPLLGLGLGLGLGSGSALRSGVGLGLGRGRGHRQALLGTLDEIADARDVVHDLGVGMQPRHLVLEDAHACVITSGPLHCGLHASHTAQGGNNDGQTGDRRRRGARECRTHGRLVRYMPQRHLVRPGTRRCKLARRDYVCLQVLRTGTHGARAQTVSRYG